MSEKTFATQGIGSFRSSKSPEDKQAFIDLHFLNEDLEKRFIAEWNDIAILRFRKMLIGIILILFIVWTGVSILKVVDAQIWVTRTLTTIYLITVIAATYAKWFTRYYQPVAGFLCFLFSVAMLYPTFQHDASHVTMSVLPVTIIVSLGIAGAIRLRFVVIIPLVFSIASFFLWMAVLSPNFDRNGVWLSSIWLVNTLGLAALIAREIESQAREVFINRVHLENERSQLEIERNRAETLLLNILPPAIAERLKQEPDSIADSNEPISILFADIVGFTPLSKELGPEKVVEMLNELFHEFDRIVMKYGVEKIKTIGDAYMAAAGVPVERDDHCHVIARCALEMMEVVKNYKTQGGKSIELRIGIHCGPAIAGVIGAHKFAYDLWGDTVNTASRMESHGQPSRIHVSQEVYELLKDEFTFESRGLIEIKGKGKMHTWWLIYAPIQA